MISKVTTIPILISSNPIVIWGEGKTILSLICIYPIESFPVTMKDWVILILNKASPQKKAKIENELDINYAIGNTNTQRQENELAAIMKKRNSAGWKLISTSTAIVDTKKVFKSLSILGKEIVININTLDNL